MSQKYSTEEALATPSFLFKMSFVDMSKCLFITLEATRQNFCQAGSDVDQLREYSASEQNVTGF